MLRWLFTTAYVFLVLTSLNGCGADSTSQAGGSKLGQPLASPFSLALPKSASVVFKERHCLGGHFQQLAPYSFHNAEPYSQRAKFTPDYAPAAAPPARDFAYAMYAYDVSSFGVLEGQVRYSFAQPPADYGDMWVGLSDWDTGRWRWFDCTGDTLLDTGLANLNGFVDGKGILALVVVMLGTGESQLDWLGVGGNLPPEASYEIDPSAPAVGEQVSFSSASSADWDGSIAKYEYDFGEGAGYQDFGATNDAAYTYNTAGTYITHLRVTDDAGLTDTDSITIEVDTPAHGVVPSLTCDPATATVLHSVAFDASGSLPSTGASITDYTFDFDGDGTADQTGTSPTGAFAYPWAGNYTVSVTVTDDAAQSETLLVQIEAVEARTWQLVYEKPARPTFGLVDAGGRPALAYVPDNQVQVLYTRALDGQGATWPAEPTLLDIASTFTGCMSTAIVDGTPALVYVSNPQQYHFWVRYAHAGAATGLPEGNWTINNVVDMGYVVEMTQLGLASAMGKPAITYPLRTDEKLYYRRANDVNGSTWSSPVVIEEGYSSSFSQCLTIVNGMPAIAYQSGPDLNHQSVCVRRATNLAGSAWGAPAVVIEYGMYSYGRNGLCLRQAGGITAVTYQINNSGKLQFAREDTGVWDSVSVEPNNAIGYWSTWDMLGGKPVIAAKDNYDGQLVFMRALDATGSTWPNTSTVLDGVADSKTASEVGNYARMLVINDTPVIAYYNATAGTVRVMALVE
jgi:PKD repeat protein